MPAFKVMHNSHLAKGSKLLHKQCSIVVKLSMVNCSSYIHWKLSCSHPVPGIEHLGIKKYIRGTTSDVPHIGSCSQLVQPNTGTEGIRIGASYPQSDLTFQPAKGACWEGTSNWCWRAKCRGHRLSYPWLPGGTLPVTSPRKTFSGTAQAQTKVKRAEWISHATTKNYSQSTQQEFVLL